MHKVFITHFAKENLKFICEYYKSIGRLAVANKIKQEVKTAMQTLKDEKIDWQEDEF